MGMGQETLAVAIGRGNESVALLISISYETTCASMVLDIWVGK